MSGESFEDDNAKKKNTDYLLRRLGGCGLFQILLTSCVSLSFISGCISTIFMAFGNYNPGWRCLENMTTTTLKNDSQQSTPISPLDFDFRDTNIYGGHNKTRNQFIHTCEQFPACKNVEFNPEASTIVTEWGLICEDSWKTPFIIFLQMIGTTIGVLSSGYIGDCFGRKVALCGSILLHSLLVFVSIVSLPWEMFAAFRFLLGFSCGIVFPISGVYLTEYVTPKWRTVILSLPTWCFGCVIFSVCTLIFKDWRKIHIFNGVLSTLLFLPMFIFPESLRWLRVTGKTEKATKAVELVAKLNRVALGDVHSIADSTFLKTKEQTKKRLLTTIKSVFHLFRRNNLAKTLILAFVISISNLVYFSTTFGLSLLPGDIYVINIIVYSTELPANIFCWFMPNIIGRKKSGILGCLVQSISLFAFIVFDTQTTGTLKEIGAVISIIVIRICCDIGFFVTMTCTSEIFPTVIRSVAVAFVQFMSGIGATISPYTVTDESSTFVSFIMMGALSLICSGLFFFIPETLGLDLKDDFGDDNYYLKDNNVNDKSGDNDEDTDVMKDMKLIL